MGMERPRNHPEGSGAPLLCCIQSSRLHACCSAWRRQICFYRCFFISYIVIFSVSLIFFFLTGLKLPPPCRDALGYKCLQPPVTTDRSPNSGMGPVDLGKASQQEHPGCWPRPRSPHREAPSESPRGSLEVLPFKGQAKPVASYSFPRGFE